MNYAQIITPNPNIPCQPGWCLQYVRQAFDLPARYGSATEAWEASPSKHRDRSFPAGCWVPVWFSLANEPAGHVALMAPDGSVFSTSDLGSVPHHHLDLSDLMNYYARYDMTLTYLGWTEDVAGYPVITDGGIAAQGIITPASQEDELSAAAEAQISRVLQILEAQESDNIRQRIVAIDDRTAVSGTKYLKGDKDATLYSFEGGKLRGINLTEWQATGQGYRTLPQDIIDALPKG